MVVVFIELFIFTGAVLFFMLMFVILKGFFSILFIMCFFDIQNYLQSGLCW